MNARRTYEEMHAICPSCHQDGLFTYAGEQHVPAIVAERLGWTSDCVDLWHCPNCQSTISQPELEKTRS